MTLTMAQEVQERCSSAISTTQSSPLHYTPTSPTVQQVTPGYTLLTFLNALVFHPPLTDNIKMSTGEPNTTSSAGSSVVHFLTC